VVGCLLAAAADGGGVTFIAASLFAGAGGSSLGYRHAGFYVRFANEWDSDGAETYELNKDPETVVDRRSVVEVTGADVLAACGGELDLLDASPPCQGFSMAGQRHVNDPRNQLYYEAVRILGEARPRAFAFENVKGMSMGVAKGHLIKLLGLMEGHGYRVEWDVLNFSRLGVPQLRERVIIIGFRDDLGIDPRAGFPAPFRHQATVNDYLPHVGMFGPAPTVTTAGLDARQTGWPIRNSDGSVVRRNLTIEELKELCTFPQDYELTGTLEAQRRRLGNAVPPTAAYTWGAAIADALEAYDAEVAA
jgi:site-specific DNA-cytosine methylase